MAVLHKAAVVSSFAVLWIATPASRARNDGLDLVIARAAGPWRSNSENNSNASCICACEISVRSTINAMRSINSGATRSSSSTLSSNNTKPNAAGISADKPSRCTSTSWRSITDASRAANAGEIRSAIGTTNTPLCTSASTPLFNTGLPVLSVAARSSPPSRRSS